MENNQWPPLTECAQYKYGMIQPFLGQFAFEEEANVEDSYYYSSDDEDRMENTHQVVKKFLKQVRESRGYDVDCMPPSGFFSPFRKVNLSTELENNEHRDEVMKATQLAVDKINEETGKTYKLKDLEKVVETTNLMTLLTFTAKEVVPGADAETDPSIFQAMVRTPPFEEFKVEEWRFRPDSVAPESLEDA